MKVVYTVNVTAGIFLVTLTMAGNLCLFLNQHRDPVFLGTALRLTSTYLRNMMSRLAFSFTTALLSDTAPFYLSMAGSSENMVKLMTLIPLVAVHI